MVALLFQCCDLRVNRSRQVVVLLIQRSGRLNRVVCQFGELSNSFADGLAGRFLHGHCGLGYSGKALTGNLPIASQKS
ncbi:hypothetical protein D3C84_530490 [compost metagenome]